MIGMRIKGLGKAVPKRTVSNDELSQLVDTSDEWITSRTGIRSRHIATTETTTTLAIEAAREAVVTSELSKEAIDLVIVATVSPDTMMPSTACKVAEALGIEKATCFDVTAACSGFVYATQLADSLIKTGIAHNALVIGAEVLSKVVDWKDRGTCVLFADGAGAVVYEGTEDNKIYHIVTGSRPDGAEQITLETAGFDHTFYEREEVKPAIKMDGKGVYSFATTTVPRSIEEVLSVASYSADDVDWYILHQANSRIMDRVASHLKISKEKFFKNLDEHGNTSAASIPMALYDLSPKLKSGDKLIALGFGAGLTWGTMLFEWSK